MANVSQLEGRSQMEEDDHWLEVELLRLIAGIGMLSNLALLVIILGLSHLRRASNAFVFHQCLLDLLKSAYCLAFAQWLLQSPEAVWCGMLGGSYIVLVTSSAFNLLAMVMNEAYQLADQTLDIQDSRNSSCVTFGIFTIWFGSIIVNLGVAFIPGNVRFNEDLGSCVFVQGVTKNFKLQMLWAFLITVAMLLTSMYLHKLRMDIKRMGYYRLSTLVRTTFKINPADNTSHESRDRHHIRHIQRAMRRKLSLMILNTASFVAFWFPLFGVSVVNCWMGVDRMICKVLSMLTWGNSSVTPFILTLFIKVDACCPATDNEGGAADSDLIEVAPTDSRATAESQ